MDAITTLDELIRQFRTVLALASGIDKVNILNALSIRGSDLNKINGTILSTYTVDDTFIVFELLEDDSEANMTEESINDGEKLDISAAYSIKLTIYGNSSSLVSKQIVSRLLSEEGRITCMTFGMHIQDISTIESGTDFINRTMFPRKDFDIHFNCYISINKVDAFKDYISTEIQATTK